MQIKPKKGLDNEKKGALIYAICYRIERPILARGFGNMIRNAYLQLILLVFFGVLLSVDTTWSEGFIDKREIPLSPSFLSPGELSRETFYFSCYDVETFRLLNCAFTYKVIGLKPPPEDVGNNGGHTHNYDTHPLIEPRDGTLEFTGADSDPNKLGIKGQTQNTLVFVTHPMPQAAGKIATEATITAPFGWICVRNCFTSNSWRWERPLNVGIQGLEQMPVSGEGHWRLTGAYGEPGVTSLHLFNHYGTSSTVGTLSLIAWRYFEDTGGDSLGINDISLPKGGLFDINNDWATPHSEHRAGTDADIDRDGFDCEVDGLLWEAIEFVNKYGYVSGGQPKADLLCEDGGLKHIDFD